MFKIFNPFKLVKSTSNVIITSWGAAGTNKMESVVKNISRAANIKFLVGFNKQTHDLKLLKEVLLYYKRLGWNVKVLPSFHAKIWVIDRAAYVGSANFCPDTIHNYMHRTILTPRLNNFIKNHWSKAYNINESSKLWLLPQK